MRPKVFCAMSSWKNVFSFLGFLRHVFQKPCVFPEEARDFYCCRKHCKNRGVIELQVQNKLTLLCIWKWTRLENHCADYQPFFENARIPAATRLFSLFSFFFLSPPAPPQPRIRKVTCMKFLVFHIIGWGARGERKKSSKGEARRKSTFWDLAITKHKTIGRGGRGGDMRKKKCEIWV